VIDVSTKEAKLIQLGYVTHDLDAAVAWFERHMGAKGFDRFGSTRLETAIVDGVASPWEIEVAGTYLGGLNVELIRPVDGAVSMYTDVMKPDALVAFHHVALGVDDWGIAEEARTAHGLEWKTRGHTPGVCDFVEFLRLDPEVIEMMAEMKVRFER
jgi:catechol 2,3-dioxygenase-like lactoylglutathione lyase family enzyme